MSYFIVFNKKGHVIHEEGTKPIFINGLIESIDLTKLQFKKNVRDYIFEYEIRGLVIYLSVGMKECLSKYMIKYLSKDQQPDDNEVKKDVLNFSDSFSSISNITKEVAKKSFKKTFSLFTNKISIDELEKKMMEFLTSKNIEHSFSEIITENVMSELRDEKLEYVTEAHFKHKISSTINKIVPSVDHQTLLNKIRSSKGVYKFCFVGVNGVGKSTSLAKMAYWLLQNDLKVFIAACDTFRAGAVEQLKIHVSRFKAGGHEVGFYERGYAKDDASVGKSAIMVAEKQKYDVILIDTAGRMHNSTNLMQSLTKLMKVNTPDHVVYVGEALVGGDSLNHIKEFNKAVEDGHGRKIDSLLLTKVDTVDDKIGQAINLTLSSNAPILFLGAGQSNSDLLRLSSGEVAELITS